MTSAVNPNDIAIIAINGRFPGAPTLERFWHNLRDGIESVTFFTDEELHARGVSPENLNQLNFVKAAPILEEIDLFDASFFGYTPREAKQLDPQHRLFLECAWESLELAGYDPARYEGLIGVYAGMSLSTYLLFNLLTHPDLLESQTSFQVMLGNDKNFLSTRVAYHLNLKGPALDVQTACSTSLVAIHLACDSLLSFQCDMALAGGVAITMPQRIGHFYHEGGIFSGDGHCRPFDAKGQGTIFGSGLGMVVLKRLEDALNDGDMIHAVIKGSAINNDGSTKLGYTAPSVTGQADVIVRAQGVAGITADAIQYVEAHGTATSLGDPIEVEALTRAFRMSTLKQQFCALGSVKSNIGHLDAAAGVAGLIKTILSLKHKQIPPSLHFQQPNPKVDFANSPFYVNTELTVWPEGQTPRRAGVSSFGIGGTNAHVILEEAPPISDSSKSGPWQLIVLSAKTKSALSMMVSNLTDYLTKNPQVNIADVAYTLQVGRAIFPHRLMALCQGHTDVLHVLQTADPNRLLTEYEEKINQPIIWMFSGQGTQYVNMGRMLYEQNPSFREAITECASLLQPHLGFDLRQVMYPLPDQEAEMAEKLGQTAVAQTALFTMGYALAQLWQAWGIRPIAMIGHSLGEYVAACLAGVFTLSDALALVAARGKLMQQMPGGAMLAVSLSEEAIKPFLTNSICLAAVNTPTDCVVSGPYDSIQNLQQRLAIKHIPCQYLHTSHAFHSTMMDDMLESFAVEVKKIKLVPPQKPFVSSVTGTWITIEAATDPDYWVRQIVQPVRFADSIKTLYDSHHIFLELGPDSTLSNLVRRMIPNNITTLASLGYQYQKQNDMAYILTTMGRLWLAGGKIEWSVFYESERRHRLSLPVYPFARQSYWFDPKPMANPRSIAVQPDMADWFYIPSWKRTFLPEPHIESLQSSSWLVFVDTEGWGFNIGRQLGQQGQYVIQVHIGENFQQINQHTYKIRPGMPSDYEALVSAIQQLGEIPAHVIHCWSVSAIPAPPTKDAFAVAQTLGYYSLLFLVQALDSQEVISMTKAGTKLNIHVLANGLYDVGMSVEPAKATLTGLCKVISQEYHRCVTCRTIDVAYQFNKRLLDALLVEFSLPDSAWAVTFRGNQRWIQTFEAVRLSQKPSRCLRQGGVYLITGGLGKIGLKLASYLAQNLKARLVLVSRLELPVRHQWDSATTQQFLSMEAAGAEILTIQADVANEEQMRRVLAQTIEHFGEIHGVFHCAGVTKGDSIYVPIQKIGIPESETQFTAKVYGLYVLKKLLHQVPLDFCFIFSSNAAVLGGLGLAAYTAANSFVDAFVSQDHESIAWLSANWDAWVDETAENVRTGIDQYALHAEKALRILHYIINSNVEGAVIVSTGAFLPRCERWLQGVSENIIVDFHIHHHRPQLPTVYVAPRYEIESRIAQIWQELMGVELIGIHDNFFDLGGHSLLITQIASRLSHMFHIEVPLRTLFESATIADMAALVVQKLTEQIEISNLAGLELATDNLQEGSKGNDLHV